MLAFRLAASLVELGVFCADNILISARTLVKFGILF